MDPLPWDNLDEETLGLEPAGVRIHQP
jgi:hypothetical protein